MDIENYSKINVINDAEQGQNATTASPFRGKRKLYLENYGCQMNFADSEIVASILAKSGITTTDIEEEADVILINTCSIRDNAEKRIRNRLRQLSFRKKKHPKLIIGVLGCMAERLKDQLLDEDKLVDIVAGPDAYRDLPVLIKEVDEGNTAVNVLLSREETYADLTPIRLNSDGVTAFVSIMRGCNNICSFCVVPFTRGRERSRDPESIINEVKYLFQEGYREVTLLGQNVDSYYWNRNSKGKIIDPHTSDMNFAQLLDAVARINLKMRIRFSTSHPKDMTDEVLYTMAAHKNICKYIHLPMQSGNSEILNNMNRGYTREWYIKRIEAIKLIIPDCAISTDIITGFCGETEEQHKDTISLMCAVKYNYAFMFKYSERPRTLASRTLKDDVPENIKSERLSSIIDVQMAHSLEHNKTALGKVYEVLIEGESKKSSKHYKGRNSQNSMIVFPKENSKIGTYVSVKITDCTAATLIGNLVIN